MGSGQIKKEKKVISTKPIEWGLKTQKNCKDTATTVHHLPTIMVDVELLWRCIFKIWNQHIWLHK